MEKEKKKSQDERDYGRNLDKMTSDEPSFFIVHDDQ